MERVVLVFKSSPRILSNKAKIPKRLSVISHKWFSNKHQYIDTQTITFLCCNAVEESI